MVNKKNAIALCLMLFAVVLYAQSLGDATSRLDALFGGQGEVQATRGGTQPLWVNDPHTVFPESTHIVRVGSAANRTMAEQRALVALAGFFGQSVRNDLSIVEVYQEAVSQGIINITSNIHIQDTIVTAVAMDSLVGAQIGRVWDNGNGTVYALSFIERQRAATIYSEMIRLNKATIESLVSMNNARRNTFDGYARYMLAANIAEINTSFANIVYLSGGPAPASWNLVNPNSLRLTAASIAENIGVSVVVDGDRNNRLRNAFTRALNANSLRTRGVNPPYTLEVSMSMNQADNPGSNLVSVRFSVSAELVDNATDSVLFAFDFNDRAFHQSRDGAENRAFILAETRINETYPAALRQWLNGILPRMP